MLRLKGLQTVVVVKGATVIGELVDTQFEIVTDPSTKTQLAL